jgi:formylglycine-generating enzyme required for sulfatase activity
MAWTNRTKAAALAAVLALGLAGVAAEFLRARGPLLNHAWCSPLPYRDCMVLVEGGEFLMGAQSLDSSAPAYDPDAEPDESPPHTVALSHFYLDLGQVTAQAFGDCVRAGGCRTEDVHSGGGYFNYGLPERQAHPVNGVTWRGAHDFCAWSGGRLPTEAEWEFAARGRLGTRFSWGDEVPDCDDLNRAIRHEGCPADGTRVTGASPIFSASGVGELSGGVWEWVADWYAEDWYQRSGRVDPVGPAEGTRRVQRGGSWQSEGYQELRGAYRAALEPGAIFADVGFRCARTPTEADRAGLFDKGRPRNRR